MRVKAVDTCGQDVHLHLKPGTNLISNYSLTKAAMLYDNRNCNSSNRAFKEA
jgi:hypothetical protein